MKVIYNCYGGSHSSVTTAAIHLGLLPSNRLPTYDEFMSLPYFDSQTAVDHGKFRFLGKDNSDNQIYISSKRNLSKYYGDIMLHVAKIAEADLTDMIFIDTMPYVNIFMVIGGYTSRRLGLINIGRPIVIYGTKLSYFKFVHLVEAVKYRLRRET